MNIKALLRRPPAQADKAKETPSADWSSNAFSSKFFLQDIPGWGPTVVQLFPSTTAACLDPSKDTTRAWEAEAADGARYNVWADCRQMAEQAVPALFKKSVLAVRETGRPLPAQAGA